MLHLDSVTGELIQIAGLLTLLLFIRKQRLPITQGVCVWCVLALSVDVFVFHCQRSTQIQEGVNALHVLLSMGILYEHYKELCRAVLVFLVSLFK
jgi:hypothetical protein